jgi:hypothetical protein
MKAAHTAKTLSTTVRLSMAMPGQSEEQRRQEREMEISEMVSKLKSQGRMNEKGESTEDSAMLEADEFFNKESPLKKFQRKKLEREQREAEADADAKKKEDIN